jgi:hypothetical protein
LENTKKRQVLIVSSPRAQRKRAVIRSQGKFLLGALFGRADSHPQGNHLRFERPSCLQRFPQVAAGASHYSKTPVDGRQEFGMLPFFLLTV